MEMLWLWARAATISSRVRGFSQMESSSARRLSTHSRFTCTSGLTSVQTSPCDGTKRSAAMVSSRSKVSSIFTLSATKGMPYLASTRGAITESPVKKTPSGVVRPICPCEWPDRSTALSPHPSSSSPGESSFVTCEGSASMKFVRMTLGAAADQSQFVSKAVCSMQAASRGEAARPHSVRFWMKWLPPMWSAWQWVLTIHFTLQPFSFTSFSTRRPASGLAPVSISATSPSFTQTPTLTGDSTAQVLPLRFVSSSNVQTFFPSAARMMPATDLAIASWPPASRCTRSVALALAAVAASRNRQPAASATSL